MHTRTRTLLVLTIAASMSMTACGSDDDTDSEHAHDGHDADEHIDPVEQDPAIAATMVASTLLSWTPAEQSSALDIPITVVDDSLTGELETMARSPSDPKARKFTPTQWDDWAAAAATVKAFVTDTEVTDEADEDAKVRATVRQDLSYPDGARSILGTTDYTITLKNIDGRWKADTFKETP